MKNLNPNTEKINNEIRRLSSMTEDDIINEISKKNCKRRIKATIAWIFTIAIAAFLMSLIMKDLV